MFRMVVGSVLVFSIGALYFGLLGSAPVLRSVGESESRLLFGGCYIPRAVGEKFCVKVPTCDYDWWNGVCTGTCDTCAASPSVKTPLQQGYGYQIPNTVITACPVGTTRYCAGIAIPPAGQTCTSMCTFQTNPLTCGVFADVVWNYNSACTSGGGGAP